MIRIDSHGKVEKCITPSFIQGTGITRNVIVILEFKCNYDLQISGHDGDISLVNFALFDISNSTKGI